MLNSRRRIFRSLLLVSPGLLLVALAQQPNYYPQQGQGTNYPSQGPNYEQQGYDALDAVDPPSRVARISQLVGDVSVQPASVNDFSAAEVNLPMTTGDRIYTGNGALAEIQTGQLVVRTGQNADLTVTAMTDTLAQFGLAQGSAHLRSYAVSPNGTVEIDTQNVAVSVLEAGDVRVDADPNNDATIVTVLSGQVEVDGNGVQQTLQGGERARFVGSNPVSAQWLGRPGVDPLDRFSLDRDRVYQNSYASEGGYVNPGTIGAEDLGANGDWSNDADYGAVWYPRGVAYDWQPYRNGHWTWVAPWGWTWVAAEPWGFAPFHYGRWNRFGNRWGWIPGPVVVRPIYSPALVVFVGGNNRGVSAWFPLGPRETYVPWYHASPLYVNRVNVSNIYSRDTVQVRNIYNQRTTNVYVNNTTVNNRVYVNRQVATVAMSQDNFARGRRVDQNLARVRPQDLQNAQVLPHPLVTPQRGMIDQSPARALPPRMARPQMESRTDAAIQPGSFRRPQPAGLNNQPAPVARQPQGAPQGQPQGNGQGGSGQGGFGQGRFGQNGNGQGNNGQNGNGNGNGRNVNGQGGAQVQGGANVPPVQSGPAVQQQRPVQNQPQTNMPEDNGRGYRPGNNKVGSAPAPPTQPTQTGAPGDNGRTRQGNDAGGSTNPPTQPAGQQRQPSQGGLNIPVRPIGPTQAPAQPSQPSAPAGGMNIPVRPVGPTQVPAQQPTQPREQQQPPREQQQQPREQQQQPQREQPRQFQQPGGQPERALDPGQSRALYNRAVPPEPRPSFEQQRQAIQQTDPGRPLGPQQLNNLRQNQPAGQQPEREQPHPQQQQQQQQRPAPQPQAQPQRTAPPAQPAAPRSEPK